MRGEGIEHKSVLQEITSCGLPRSWFINSTVPSAMVRLGEDRLVEWKKYRLTMNAADIG
jgi:hypothetical protein